MMADSSGLPRQLALMRGSPNDASLAMEKLNARVRPGLTASQFYKIFTQCACDKFMTRRAFRHHYCKHTVIDLTNDSSTAGTPEPTTEGDDDVLDLTSAE